MPFNAIDLKKINTYPLRERSNLVKLKDLVYPGSSFRPFESEELKQVAEDIVRARRAGRPVIWMMGAHVIKCGLGPLLIDLMQKGLVTHFAGNGAVAIHDLELAMIGETSEDVATSIEDGTFGMAEETGAMTHLALRNGVRDGLGYGESLGRLIDEMQFPHRENSVLYQAYRLRVPMTIHATIGADIIHQHPDSDFGILGAATGQDFKIFCASVAGLENGVFLNFGSAVTGAEVFLKAISITRNLGYPVNGFTTANFDLYALGKQYHTPVGKDVPEYYYRPRKNVVNRPTSQGGRGYHIQGDHIQTIPTLHEWVCSLTADETISRTVQVPEGLVEGQADPIQRVRRSSPAAASAVEELLQRRPYLSDAAGALCKAYELIARSMERGGTLFLAGNGGSMSDALHISGELLKSFGGKRPLPPSEKVRLAAQPEGEQLANSLEGGLRAVVLGANLSLSSAVGNDFAERGMNLAQELHALARPGDVFLGISTSGKARNVRLAASTAHARGLDVVIFTGSAPSPLSEMADVAVHAPEKRTDLVQEEHIALYHCLCDMLERRFFGNGSSAS